MSRLNARSSYGWCKAVFACHLDHECSQVSALLRLPFLPVLKRFRAWIYVYIVAFNFKDRKEPFALETVGSVYDFSRPKIMLSFMCSQFLNQRKNQPAPVLLRL